MSKILFKVTVNEKEYNCYRETSGVRVIRQTVCVIDLGLFEDDTNDYGNGDRYTTTPSNMQFFAEQIAKGLIGKSKGK
jgi:hypothetical protein